MLPTVDFGKIRPHQGARHRGFEELCFQLLPDLSDLPSTARVVRHGTPDGGVEFLATLPDGSVQGWQAKYLFKLESSELAQMDRSVKAALDSQPGLTHYTFCLPYNRPAGDVPGAKSAMERWHGRRRKWERWAADRGMAVEFDYKGESELLAALNRPHQAGRAYYWFDVTVLTPCHVRTGGSPEHRDHLRPGFGAVGFRHALAGLAPAGASRALWNALVRAAADDRSHP